MKKSLIIKLSASIVGMIFLSVAITIPIGDMPGIGGLLSPIGGIWNGAIYAEYPENKIVSGTGYSGTVYRDELGIPHIFASDFNSFGFMMGYLQATDRIFSMEMQKRLIAGRLSEILGPDAIDQDKYMRLMGFRRSGEELWANILTDKNSDPELQTIVTALNAYCEGVNKYIDEITPNKLPMEFIYLGISPEYWTPEDVMAFLKYESFSLSFHEYDLLMTLLRDAMGTETAEELVPYEPYPFETVVIPNFETPTDGGISKSKSIHDDGFDTSSLSDDAIDRNQLLGILEIFRTYGDPFGLKEAIVQACSNNWVINGSLSYSGKPILCNDPHLPIILPPIWWEFQFVNTSSEYGESVYGVSFPGAPIAEIGHTNYIAWGATVTAYDQNDFYAEKLTPNGEKYYFNSTELRDVEKVTEVIKVKGQADYHYDIKFTRHNYTEQDDFKCPIINSTEWGYPGGLNLSMKWTGYADDYGIIKGFFRLNQARNFSDYEDAMEVYSYPGQNFVYADIYGNIALYPTANYPVRNVTGAVKQGRYILNGSNGQDEWTGYIPFEWIPHKVNPDQMYLASANQRTVNTTEYTEYYTSYAFAESYRARRINQLLENASKYGYTIDIEKMKEIQTDYYDVAAEVFVPYLLQAFDDKYPTGVDSTGTTELLNKSIESLRSWNKSKSRWIMDKDLIAPAIFDTWLNDYGEHTFNDEITDVNLSISGVMTRVLNDFLENITRYDQNSHWFNDTSTSNTENASKTMLKALNSTLSYLNNKLGDFDNWQWGNMHKMDIRYLMGMVSLPDFDFPQYPCSGSSRTINVRSGEYVHSGSSMRMIIDFQMLSNKSLYSGYLTLPGGQSGNPLSSHYSDNHELWKNDEYQPILFPNNISAYPTSEIYSTVVFS